MTAHSSCHGTICAIVARNTSRLIGLPVLFESGALVGGHGKGLLLHAPSTQQAARRWTYSALPL
jgi:hypothetical protein